MVEQRVPRRLAAILVADVVGYSRLMEADEAGTLAALREPRKTILEPVAREHGGRIVKVMGDGVLVEFASAVNAVQGALELQKEMAEANETLPEGRRIVLRIGINLGDVIGEGADIYGEGVNIAARLEALAEPGGICISGKVHDEVRGKIGIALEDAGDRQLKNIAMPVRTYRVGYRSTPAAGPVHGGKSSIAVLPFDNLSGDPGQQYLSDGITEDIITELSRFRNLSVAARHASFHIGGKSVEPIRAARELGVNYVVEGSVRKTGERIRITVQLIDAGTGNHVWAERYDREAADIFAVQDEVVAAIVATLEGRMVAAGAALARRKPTASWSAYECLLQGRELSNSSKESTVPYLARAIAIDPEFTQAHAWLAFGLLGVYWQDPDPSTLNQASLAAQKALELDSTDPTVHHANAMVMLWLRQHEQAGRHFERAVLLNPADAQIRADRANWFRYMGRPDEALAAIDDALQRSKFPPHWFWRVRGGILLQLRRYGEAIEAFGNMPQKDYMSWVQLASAQGHLGLSTDAMQALAKAKEFRPSISLRELAQVIPYLHSEDLDHLLDGLRKAGLPE